MTIVTDENSATLVRSDFTSRGTPDPSNTFCKDETVKANKHRYTIKAWSEFAVAGTATATTAMQQQHAAQHNG